MALGKQKVSQLVNTVYQKIGQDIQSRYNLPFTTNLPIRSYVSCVAEKASLNKSLHFILWYKHRQQSAPTSFRPVQGLPRICTSKQYPAIRYIKEGTSLNKRRSLTSGCTHFHTPLVSKFITTFTKQNVVVSCIGEVPGSNVDRITDFPN